MVSNNESVGVTESAKRWENVLVEVDNGVAWVTLNRPEKRNCMNPALHDDMVDVLNTIELDDSASVLVLTGAGDAFSAGMDLKQYFRELDMLPPVHREYRRRSGLLWQGQMLREFSKPTIAMVNGWCMGAAFVPLVSCDLAIAAEDAMFGLSEINWGIIPAGNVTRAVVATMSHRDAMYYVMTGKPFDGKKAAEMRLVNEAVPRDQLRARTAELAQELASKNPSALRACKQSVRNVHGMPWDLSQDYLLAKVAQAEADDVEGGKKKALKQFLDDKTYRPGIAGYDRAKET